jgi:hypothetical protein
MMSRQPHLRQRSTLRKDELSEQHFAEVWLVG